MKLLRVSTSATTRKLNVLPSRLEIKVDEHFLSLVEALKQSSSTIRKESTNHSMDFLRYIDWKQFQKK